MTDTEQLYNDLHELFAESDLSDEEIISVLQRIISDIKGHIAERDQD